MSRWAFTGRHPDRPRLPLWLVPPLILGAALGIVLAVFVLLIRAAGRALAWFGP